MATPAQLFAKARRYPFGRQLFSRAVTHRAPYFASISPLFLELRSGHCEVFVRKQRKVLNHIGTVNAIALCAMCELGAGTMLESSLPKNLRWIPRGMVTRYLGKADTDVTMTVALEKPIAMDFSGDLIVPARVRNSAGVIVMEADITMYVSPRRDKPG